MTKFNVGDKVRILDGKALIGNGGYKVTKGKEYEVISFHEKSERETEHIKVVDNFSNPFTICNWEYKYIELADSKPTKNQRITTLETEVADLKLIVHELRDRPQLTTVVNNIQEPSTINDVEDIIEFEGAEYRKVKRKARDSDVVISRAASTLLMSAGKPYKVKGQGDGDVVVINKSCDEDMELYNDFHTEINIDVYELIKEKQLSPNEQRAQIIEDAKKFVEQVIERGKNSEAPKVDEGHAYYKNHFFDVDLVVKNNKITALVFLNNSEGLRLENKPDLINRAECAQNDVFNEHIGKAIALGRALNIDVSEFEQAVQPTTPISGMYCKHKATKYEGELTEFDSGCNHWEGTGYIWGSHSINLIILNDTNAQYGGVE